MYTIGREYLERVMTCVFSPHRAHGLVFRKHGVSIVRKRSHQNTLVKPKIIIEEDVCGLEDLLVVTTWAQEIITLNTAHELRNRSLSCPGLFRVSKERCRQFLEVWRVAALHWPLSSKAHNHEKSVGLTDNSNRVNDQIRSIPLFGSLKNWPR